MRKPEWLQKTEVIFGTEGAEKVAEYCRRYGSCDEGGGGRL